MTALVFVCMGSLGLLKPLAHNKKNARDVAKSFCFAAGAAVIWDIIFLASQFR